MKALDPGFDAAVLQISRQLMPEGYDTSFDAPNTYEKLLDHFASGKRPLVWPGASQFTIYGSAEVNYSFRAWHDWCHWRGRFDFSLAGETAAFRMQDWHLRKVSAPEKWRSILHAEVLGQARYLSFHKRFPEAQRAFVEAYLIDPDQALRWPLW